jgi:hypothetical protein
VPVARMSSLSCLYIDERLLSYVQVRFPGYIRNAFANATYQYVRKGEALFTLYSPDLVATQQEYCWHGRIRNLTGRRWRLKAQCNAYGRNRHDYLDHSRPDPDVAFFVMMKERALKRGTLVPKDQESTSTP